MTRLPRGASSSWDTIPSSPDMGGFTLAFFVPFERLEVYDELLVADNPLGATAENMNFTILRPGYDPNDEVRG